MEQELTIGQKVIGTFNPNGNPKIEKIKQLAAELYDEIESIPTNGRTSAMIKTAAQVNLLNAQMESCKLPYLPKDV